MSRIYNNSNKIIIPEILKRLIDVHQSIKMKSEILARWREISQAVSGAPFSHNYNYSSGNKKYSNYQSKVETHAVKILTLEENLKKDTDELSKLTEKFLNILDKIEDIKCRELLTYRYLCGNTWEQVAEQMSYSYIHVLSRLHPKALKLVELVTIA